MNTPHDLNALFARQPSGLDFPGPFSCHDVVLHDHQVPFLQAAPTPDGVRLILDSRSAIDLTMPEAERVIPFMADAIAVALGYTCHPNPNCPEPKQTRPFKKMVAIRSAQREIAP
jgi:hypothetical protein